mgnify:CR=1 FL=1
MANDSSNVSFGKPKATGAVYIAPAGTSVPTDATSELNVAFKNLGYISEDGLVNSVSTDKQEVNAWGGDKVLSEQTTFGETFTVNLLETNEYALKTYYGEDNVEVDGTNITITQNSTPLPEVVAVFELVLTGGRVKRIVVPKAKIADRSGDITYADGSAVMYPAVFDALPDTDGNTHVEYIAVVAS